MVVLVPIEEHGGRDGQKGEWGCQPDVRGPIRDPTAGSSGVYRASYAKDEEGEVVNPGLVVERPRDEEEEAGGQVQALLRRRQAQGLPKAGDPPLDQAQVLQYRPQVLTCGRFRTMRGGPNT